MKDVLTVGVVGLILYLLLRDKDRVEKFAPYAPTESVTSTIIYGELVEPVEPVETELPPSTLRYVPLEVF